jgi:hypothetical protein
MKQLLSCAAILASLSIAGAAIADEVKDAPKSQRGVITLPPKIITGKPQRPLASVEVSRMEPALTLTELCVPLVERIETAIYSTLF